MEIMENLKGRCLFWISNTVLDKNNERKQRIQCFNKRTELKKFGKDK
jgi:hypothetical protein